MKKPQTCNIEYLGYEAPESPEELRFELSGLEHLISKANERICSLKQSLILAEMIFSDQEKEKNEHNKSQ